MALVTTRIPGTRYTLRQGATPTTLGGGEDAILEITRDQMDVYNKASAGNREYTPTIVRWNMQGLFQYLASGARLKGCSASLTIGGIALLEATRFTFGANVELKEAITTSTSCGRAVTPFVRNYSCDFDGLYVDPANAAAPDASALDDYIANVNGGATALTCVLTLGGSHTLSFSANGERFRMGNPKEDHATVSGSLRVTGAVTVANTGLDAGLKAIMDDIFIADIADMAGFDIYMENVINGAGNTRWYGACYGEQFSLEVDVNTIIKANITCQGNGALTEAVVV